MRTTHRHVLLGGLLAVVLAVSATACGSEDDSSAPSAGSTASASASPSEPASESPSASASASASASPAAVTITIKDFAYDVPGTVAPGATVMVTNEDTEAHTVTADDKGGFDVKIDPGATAMLKAPGEAGSYDFHCTYHSNMEGTLKVG